jgi:archaellum component FlaG (FlaF/FlaG flagellin family)
MSNKQKKLVMTPEALAWMKNHISQMAFYVHESGTYRILHTNDSSFLVVDENTGEEHEVQFADVDIEAENFLQLQPFSLSHKSFMGS